MSRFSFGPASSVLLPLSWMFLVQRWHSSRLWTGFGFCSPGLGARCTCMPVLGTCVFLEHPRKTRAGCTGRSCACEFLSWTAGPVGRGQISQEMEGLFPSLNPVPAPLQVTDVPLLCRDTAEILVPVLRCWRCFCSARAAMVCDCYNVR